MLSPELALYFKFLSILYTFIIPKVFFCVNSLKIYFIHFKF